MHLVKIVKKFLNARWDGTQPLLLGYSGGPDSKGLLYALLEAGVSSLHLAHVDHAWRPTSVQQAMQLADEAAHLKLPFHTIRLEKRPLSNWEEFGRLARLQFFRSLFDTIGFAALLLAHHGDDAAETSLKRLFEGAHLTNLGGIAKDSRLEGMPIWRPLLEVSKKDILHYLAAKQLKPLVDVTNEDPRFLRTRLRGQILPPLEQSFGKNIHSNLRHLSERSFELKEYLDQVILLVWEQRLEGPWGICLSMLGLKRIEARHALLTMAAEKQISLSRALLEHWLDALLAETADIQLQANGRILYADRGRAFILSANAPCFAQPIQVQAGHFTSGDWTVEIGPLDHSLDHSPKKRGWEEIWKGCFVADLPNGYLQLPDSGSALQEEWRKEKVPAFFRRRGVIVRNDQKIFELMTKKLADIEQMHWTARFFIRITP